MLAAPAWAPPAPDLPAPALAYQPPATALAPAAVLAAPAYAPPAPSYPPPVPAYQPPVTQYAPVLAVPTAAVASPTQVPAPEPAPAALWTGTDPLAWASDPQAFVPEHAEQPPAGPPEAPIATARSRRPLRLALLAVALAAVGALVYFVGLPMLNGSDDEAATPTGPHATLVRPGALAGLPLVAEAASAPAVRAATGAPVRNNPMLVAAGYGRGGKVQLAVSSTVTNSPENPVAGITTRFDAFRDRTKAALGKPVTVSVPRTTMQCATTAAAKTLAAGSLCVWVDPMTAGQVWLVGATPANAAVVAERARSSVVRTS